MREFEETPAAEDATFAATEVAAIVANMPQRPPIKHGMSQAYYTPANDMVGIHVGFFGHMARQFNGAVVFEVG